MDEPTNVFPRCPLNPFYRFPISNVASVHILATVFQQEPEEVSWTVGRLAVASCIKDLRVKVETRNAVLVASWWQWK